MPALPPLALPRIWNFPGAYVVWLMTGVSCSTAVYTIYHYIKDSPDVELYMEMRHDETKGNSMTAERARQHTSNSLFRKIASLRDRSVPGGFNDKDTRIFRAQRGAPAACPATPAQQPA